MPDGRDQLVMDCGEELRRVVETRRKRRSRLAIAALIGCAIIPLSASTMWEIPVVLVWNASASAPIGLYRVHSNGSVRRGDMVAAWTPDPARSLAARRRYLPSNVPLVKRVAAVAGDRICADESNILLNGRRVATRRKFDGADRPMPWWIGCRRLENEQFFLLMDSALSFDGRYFGVTGRSEILGKAELLWAR